MAKKDNIVRHPGQEESQEATETRGGTGGRAGNGRKGGRTGNGRKGPAPVVKVPGVRMVLRKFSIWFVALSLLLAILLAQT